MYFIGLFMSVPLSVIPLLLPFILFRDASLSLWLSDFLKQASLS